ncbi:hypothetical protein AGMMS49579_12880 [Spirochaetia bacterium]|nr:hypothetical protein AGMMS49579_12880 [Spirochaetia bacterium]
MKKLSISRALIGLFVVLAVGIGLAACEVGTYEQVEDDGTTKTTKVIKLEPGNKATSTVTEAHSSGGSIISIITMTGTYIVNGDIIVITWTSSTSGSGSPVTINKTEIFRLVGTSLIDQTGLTKKKSVGNEIIELELANDLSAEELEALGL